MVTGQKCQKSLRKSKREADELRVIIVVLGNRHGKVDGDGHLAKNWQYQPDACAHAPADGTELEAVFNIPDVGKDHAAQGFADHGEAQLGASGDAEVAAHAVVFRARARANPAEAEAAHRSDAAAIKPLEERRPAGNVSNITMQRENGPPIQQVFAERLVSVE